MANIGGSGSNDEHLLRLHAPPYLDVPPVMELIGEFLETFEEFPPRMKPSSYNPQVMMERLLKWVVEREVSKVVRSYWEYVRSLPGYSEYPGREGSL